MPSNVPCGRQAAIRSFSLVASKLGMVCHHDFRDGLGAPLLR
ncbi:MAG: hypothetical protein WD066_15595 [Planctomycetaceae bacterium]